ncbi:MAG TPA: serine hydrolase, partial [Flavitalea sp.]|nr:serine hydrolase [Flavitalea sp.]
MSKRNTFFSRTVCYLPVLLLLQLLSFPIVAQSQEKTDRFLEKLVRRKADDQLKMILNHPDSFRYQLIYTKIDRNEKNEPRFRNYYFHLDPSLYFNPASMVKLPTALIALEKLNDLQIAGLDRSTPMFTDSGYEKQTAVSVDASSEIGLPSIGHYIKKVFLVSDNEAYNRLYEFIG